MTGCSSRLTWGWTQGWVLTYGHIKRKTTVWNIVQTRWKLSGRGVWVITLGYSGDSGVSLLVYGEKIKIKIKIRRLFDVYRYYRRRSANPRYCWASLWRRAAVTGSRAVAFASATARPGARTWVVGTSFWSAASTAACAHNWPPLCGTQWRRPTGVVESSRYRWTASDAPGHTTAKWHDVLGI